MKNLIIYIMKSQNTFSRILDGLILLIKEVETVKENM